MPTPDRTSLDAIVLAARELLEDEGLTGVTMSAVANRVGVRAPSLYKRVASRERLIQLVAEATLVDLAAHLAETATPRDALDGFRAFGHAHPGAFRLVMAPAAGVPTARPEFGGIGSAAVLRFAGELAGEENRLVAARTLTAWVAGFVTMELNGSFQLGGDVEEAWRFGAAAIVEAVTRS